MTRMSSEEIDKKIEIPFQDVSIRTVEAHFIHDFLLDKKLTKTLEVGLAYGQSACYIMGATNSNHVVLDPYQDFFDNQGLQNIEKLGMNDLLEFHAEPSYLLLPDFVKQGRKFNFIFIDADHRFDSILVDFWFADALVEIGGYVLLHDAWMRSTSLVANFIRTNRKDYVFLPSLGNFVLIQKIDHDRRDGMHFEEFYSSKSKPLYRLIKAMSSEKSSLLKKLFKHPIGKYIDKKLYGLPKRKK